jgi:DNA-binding NarL/FixJ family response regulator
MVSVVVVLMRHIATLIDAPDDLSRAGVIGVLAGARYKPFVVKGGWEALVASRKRIPKVVILVLSGTIKDVAPVDQKINAIAKLSKVVVLGDSGDPNLVRLALRAGGSVFLPCSVAAEILIQAINLALDGKIVFPSQSLGEVFACRKLDTKPGACLHEKSISSIGSYMENLTNKSAVGLLSRKRPSRFM